jgi:hypothetical protein
MQTLAMRGFQAQLSQKCNGSWMEVHAFMMRLFGDFTESVASMMA